MAGAGRIRLNVRGTAGHIRPPSASLLRLHCLMLNIFARRDHVSAFCQRKQPQQLLTKEVTRVSRSEICSGSKSKRLLS